MNNDALHDSERLFDRLVDNELTTQERRELLATLDREPEGWRRCALAFLEAQEWRAAMGPPAARSAPVRPVTFVMPEPVRGYFGILGYFAKVAAGLIAAFAIGWGLRGDSARIPAPKIVKQETPVAAGSPELAVAKQTPPEPRKPDDPTAVSTTVARAWERRGYEIARSRRLVSMSLKDGRKVSVPVDEVRLKFVGDRTY